MSNFYVFAYSPIAYRFRVLPGHKIGQAKSLDPKGSFTVFCTREGAIENLIKNGYSKNEAEKTVTNAEENPFNDWLDIRHLSSW